MTNVLTNKLSLRDSLNCPAVFLNGMDDGDVQVADLISAMMFIHESDGDMPHKLVHDSQPVHKPRFRPTVIAVIAANRLITWSAVSCRVFPVCGSHGVGPISNVMCIGDIKHHANGISQHTSWFSSPQLQTVILAVVSDLKLATEGENFLQLVVDFLAFFPLMLITATGQLKGLFLTVPRFYIGLGWPGANQEKRASYMNI